MTKVTQLKLNRTYEGRDIYGNPIKRAKIIEIPIKKTVLDCRFEKFEIYVSPGQIINRPKMCKKLLKLK